MIKAKYPEVKRMIEARLASGEWLDRLPGVALLGKELGVNQLTVSKAIRLLADEGKVTILGRRGTFATRSNRNVRHGTIGIVGMLPTDKADEEGGMAIGAIQTVVGGSGYSVFSIGHASHESDKAMDGILKMPFDGLIFYHSSLTPEMICKLRAAGRSFVSMNRISDPPGVSWVDYDNESSFHMPLQYLLKRRHRRIAVIGYRSVLAEHDKRMRELYRSEMEANGLYDAGLYHVEYRSDLRKEHGPQADIDSVYTRKSIQWLERHPNPPTACLVNGGSLAKRFLEELPQSTAIPMSIIAVCPETLQLQHPDLEGVVIQKVSERAKTAARTLIQLMEHPQSEPIQRKIPMEFRLCLAV